MKKIIWVVCYLWVVGCNTTESDREVDGLLFERIHGKPNSAEWMQSLAKLSGGGYLVTGTTDGLGFGLENILLMKIDDKGNLVWQKSFGVNDQGDFGRKVMESRGGYLVAGSTHSIGAGSLDMYLFKTNTEGELIWEKRYGSDRLGEEGVDFLEVSDGYLIFGSAITESGENIHNDFFLVKTDFNGNLLWSKRYGTESDDIGKSIIQLNDGNIILGGYTFNNATYVDLYMVKINITGDVMWERQVSGPQNDINSGDVIERMKPTDDGGYIIAGNQAISPFLGFSGIGWIIKYSSAGQKDWEITLGKANQTDDVRIRSIAVVNNGYLIAGSRLAIVNDEQRTEFLVVRLNLSGDIDWENSIRLSASDEFVDISVQDDVFTIAGITFESEAWYQVYLIAFRNSFER